MTRSEHPQAENLLQPAFILHARAYRESSLLVEALTQNSGRVGLVARGARGSRSRWKSLLQPFRPLLLSWRRRGELATLTHAEQVAPLPAARGEALYCSLYANELLLRVLQRDDPHEGLFEAYRELLGRLCGSEDPEPALRVFEKRMLDSLGLGLQLVQDASGLPVEPDRHYRYVPEQGPALPAGVSEGGGERLVSGAALLALSREQPESDHLPELKWLMRRVLHYHLGDKPLKTPALFS